MITGWNLNAWQYRPLSTYFVQYEQEFFLSLVFQDGFLQLRTAAAQRISSIQNLHDHVRCLNNLHKNSIPCKINLVNDHFGHVGDPHTHSGIYYCQFVMLDISLSTCLVQLAAFECFSAFLFSYRSPCFSNFRPLQTINKVKSEARVSDLLL